MGSHKQTEHGEIVQAHLDEVTALMQACHSKFDCGDFKGALKDVCQAIQMEPHRTCNFVKRALIRQKLGQHQEAVDDATEAIQKFPGGDAPLTIRATSNLALGDFHGAVDDASQALRLKTMNTLDALGCRAEAKRQLGDHMGAIADASECIRLNPQAAGVSALYCTRGLARLSMSSLQGALRDCAYARCLEPANPLFIEVFQQTLCISQQTGDEAAFEEAQMLEKLVNAAAKEGKNQGSPASPMRKNMQQHNKHIDASMANPVPQIGLHPTSVLLLESIFLLPGEPEDFAASFTAAGIELPSLSDEDRTRVIQEVFSLTRQLTVLMWKLTLEISPEATFFVVLLLQNLSRGARKVQKACLRPELFIFIRRLLPLDHNEVSEDLMIRGFSVPGLALKFLGILLDHHPADVGSALASADSEAFVRGLAATIQRGWDAPANPGSSCWEAMVLIARMVQEFNGSTLVKIRELSRQYVWPVMQSMLLADTVPSHWLEKGWGLGERDKQVHAFKHKGSADALKITVMKKDSLLRDVDFTGRLLHDAIKFYTNGTIKKSDIHLDLISHLTTRYCHGDSATTQRAATDFVRCFAHRKHKQSFKFCQSGNQRHADIARALQSEVYGLSKCGNSACSNVESADDKYKKCANCGLERYCSRRCQKQAWAQHMVVCCNTRSSRAEKTGLVS